MKKLTINTKCRDSMIDITNIINEEINQRKINNGICVVYIPHTTAGITINENADSDVVKDLIRKLDEIIPWNDNYRHLEGNSAAHLKSTICGFSQTLIINDGKLVLGTWQSVYFCEFDGPRVRNFYIKII